MFQFNSKKLIILCRKLVGMIEDNQIAEELSEKISGVESKYTTKWELKNKWRFRVQDMIDIFNSKCLPEDKIKIINTGLISENKRIWLVVNRYNSIRKQYYVESGESVFITQEYFFEFAFGIISEYGLHFYFNNNKQIPNKCHGEESFNVTHA